MSRVKVVTRKVGIRALIFLAYLFIGAGVFLGIERDARAARNKQLETKFNEFKSKLKRDYSINDTDMTSFTSLIKELSNAGIFKNHGNKNWDFVNAFFFSGNVVTTIGYGHITPITIAGKLVCILYAIIGIPIAGYFLRTVGNELNNLFTFAIKYMERRLYNREAEKIEMKSTCAAFVLTILWLLFGGVIFAASEPGWTFVDAFYFSFITLTTIGFGDLVPGLTRNEETEIGVRLTVEMAALIYYVIGLSLLSGIIFSFSNFIEEKTKKLDIQDPMDAIRNLRIENLNTKAMKKLGYKMTNGPLDETTHFNLSMRRGTIVPDDLAPRRVSRLFEEAQRTSNKALVGASPIVPNGISTKRSQNTEDTTISTNQFIREEKPTEISNEDQPMAAVDGISLNSVSRQQTVNSMLVDVDISPVTTRKPLNVRPVSASSAGSRRKLKLRANAIVPQIGGNEDEKNDMPSQTLGTMNGKRKDPLRKLMRQSTQPEYRPTGLPSEVFGAPLKSTRRKVLERTASDSHTDELEYNEIMEEILKEHINSHEKSAKLIKHKTIRSPTPEFLSLARQFSDESTCHVDGVSKEYDTNSIA